MNRLDAIVEDLKSLSRLELDDGRHAILWKQANIRTIIEAAIEVCRTAAAAKNIELELDCAGALATVVNPPLLERALVNLIDNAINHSDVNGNVKISVAETGHGLEIRVQDFGSAIAKIHHARLFATILPGR